jgi:hypothetical protein
MDPVTLTAISIGTTAAAGGVSAFGALSGGASKKAMYQYQAGIADTNSKIAKQNADYAIRVGESQAMTQGLKTRQQVGTAIATRGASGLDVNKGSNARVVQSVEMVGEHNEAIIRSDAAKRAYGYEVEAASATANATIARMAGDDASKAGTISALGSILGTAGSVSSKWVDAEQRGIFS